MLLISVTHDISVTVKGGYHETTSMAQATGQVGYDGLATLKLLALGGGLSGQTEITCSTLGSDLDVSDQTASRRLQELESEGYIKREILSDGQNVTVTDEGRRWLQREYADYRRLFEGSADVTLTGHVTSGMGEGRHYISLSGYMRQFKDRLGYEPFPGTLNLELEEESVRTRARMDALDPVPIDGWEDGERTYGPAFCWPASIERRGQDDDTDGVTERYETVHVIAPERTHHGDDQLELIAPDRLRNELELEDGDYLSIHVSEQ